MIQTRFYKDDFITSQYLQRVLDGETLAIVADNVVASIEEAEIEFDAIAFTGVSGALVAPLVAALMRKSLLLVRKKSWSTHSFFDVEGCLTVDRYIIIDDVIESGKTVKTILRKINKVAKRAECVGIWLYEPDYYDSETFEYKGKSIPVTEVK